MAKSNKKAEGSRSGFTGILFIGVLFLFGILVWVYLQTSRKDYTQFAVKFDSELSDLLVAGGISDSNILSQSRKEKSSPTHVWVEYYKEIELPPAKIAAIEKLSSAIKALAEKNALTFSSDQSEGLGKTRIDVTFNKVLLSRIILISGAAPKPPEAKSKPGKRVAIVIDDLGYTNDISGFLELGIPITFAILPKEVHSKHLAQTLTKLKMPYILHLPLEPEGFPKVNPGKAALLRSMNPQEIKKMFESDFAWIKGACGVSNHMGSAFSADAVKMRELLLLVKEKKVFYFDSYTTPKSKAGKVARELKMPFLENKDFLDDKDEPAAIKKQLDILLRQVEKRGTSIAIAHINKKNVIPSLKEYIPKFKEKGIEFVFLPDLLK